MDNSPSRYIPEIPVPFSAALLLRAAWSSGYLLFSPVDCCVALLVLSVYRVWLVVLLARRCAGETHIMLAPPLKKEHPESRCLKFVETETDDQMHTYGALLAELENED